MYFILDEKLQSKFMVSRCKGPKNELIVEDDSNHDYPTIVVEEENLPNFSMSILYSYGFNHDWLKSSKLIVESNIGDVFNLERNSKSHLFKECEIDSVLNDNFNMITLSKEELSNSNQNLKIRFSNNLPFWIKNSSTSDDSDIVSNTLFKTINLEQLLESIFESYKTAYPNINCYSEMKIKIVSG